MAKYDPDRIAELVAGLLKPAEAADLENEIAADPRAAAELAAQRLALEALRQAPAPVLSAEERADLRRAVASALDLEETRPAGAVSSRRRVPWRPLAVAAAALVVVAAVVPLVGLLSVGQDQTAMTGQSESAVSPRIGEEDGDTGLLNESLPDATVTSASDTTVATLYSATPPTIDELLAHPEALIAAADPDLATCRAEAEDLLGQSGDPAGAALLRESGEAEVVVWFMSADGETLQSLAMFNPTDCSLLARHP